MAIFIEYCIIYPKNIDYPIQFEKMQYRQSPPDGASAEPSAAKSNSDAANS